MNKKIVKKVAAVSLLLMVCMSVGAQTKKQTFEGSSSFYVTPSVYSKDNTSSLYFVPDDVRYPSTDATSGEFKIYDDDFSLKKTIEFPYVTVSYYEDRQERQQTIKVKKEESYSHREQQETHDDDWNPVYEFTTATAESYITERGFQIRTKTETSESVTFYLADTWIYFMYDDYGFEYPERYYQLDKSTSHLYECQDGYISRETYTDTWGEAVRYNYKRTYGPIGLRRTGDIDYKTFYLSQTLFNNDDAYEYLMPVVTTEESGVYYEKRYDYYKEEDVDAIKVSGTTPRVTGYKIMSDNGSTVATISFDSNFIFYNSDTPDVIDLNGNNGNIYLAFDGYFQKSADETVRANVVYSIDSKTSAVRQVVMNTGMRVDPTMARRSDVITVSLDGKSDKTRQVQVVNAAGKTLKRISVPAGQNTIRINANELSVGLNVVNVDGDRGSATKIIVR